MEYFISENANSVDLVRHRVRWRLDLRLRSLQKSSVEH